MTYSEVLVESKTARNEQLAKLSPEKALETLNKVKALMMAVWKGQCICTNQQLAEFYETTESAIRNIISDHRDEFESDGIRLAKGKDVKEVSHIFGLTPNTPKITLHNTYSALRVGVLLGHSNVAREVRNVLINLAHEVPHIVETAYQAGQQSKLTTFLEQATSLAKFLDARGLKTGIATQITLRTVAKKVPEAKEMIEGVVEEAGYATPEEDKPLTPTVLAKELSNKLDCIVSAVVVNKKLTQLGLQIENRVSAGKGKTKLEYEPTALGKEFSELIPSSFSNGTYTKAKYDVRWYRSTVDYLLANW